MNNGLLTADQKIHLAPSDMVAGLYDAIKSPPSTLKQYPLMLISGGRRLATFNTWTHNPPDLTKEINGNHAIMKVKDTQSLEIAAGTNI